MLIESKTATLDAIETSLVNEVEGQAKIDLKNKIIETKLSRAGKVASLLVE
jgi:hypothetical protein